MIPLLYAPVQKTVAWKECLNQPAAFYASAEARRVADNLLIWQHDNGGWHKNEDMAAPLTEGKRAELIEQKPEDGTTIDNGATYTQLVFLARVSTATKTDAYHVAFFKGLDYLLAAQYPNGGWPQYWPLRKGYYTHITFNDDAMIGVMSLLREIAQGKPDYAFVDSARRAKCAPAVTKGVECILKCQVVRNGKKTAWCAQHDEVTLAPAKARAYELPSLSGMESVPIIRFLMAEKRTPAISAAIEGAVAWYQEVKITGIRFEKKDGDKVILPDPNAPPLWARFYDLETNKPFFCGRDGIKKNTLAEIEQERRTGYQWYGNRAQSLLETDYPKWKQHVLSVAADGSRPYRTVQAAVDAVPDNSTEPTIIQLQPGTYKERLVVGKNKARITLRGEDAAKTMVTFDRSARTLDPMGKPYGTSESASTLIQADNFTAENITFANSAGRGKDVGQAVAIRTSGDQVLFRKCRFTGWQDTLYATGTGRQVFQDCYIEGDVDFIFGHAAARFEHCQIHSKGQGYITAQARDTADVPGGYFFQDCTLTAASDVKPGTVYLGRPWRDFARVAFVRCTLGSHIRPEGWHNWDKPEREKTAHFAEVECTGPGAATEKRVPWAKKTAF